MDGYTGFVKMATALPFASCMPPHAGGMEPVNAQPVAGERGKETPPDESSWPNMTESTPFP